MKAKFIGLNTICIEAETNEERLLLQNFKNNKNIHIESLTAALDSNGVKSINISKKDGQ